MMKVTLLVIVMMTALSSLVMAGQFCLAGPGVSPQCIFDDAAVCIRASDPPTTACTINPDANLNYSGNSRYCTVSSSQVAECIYADRDQCNSEAVQRRGVCVDRLGMNDKYNPYRYDPRVQY